MTDSYTHSETLLERIEATTSIETLVGALYFNILSDRRLAHFFEGVALDRVLAHQRRFLSVALGGGDRYAGRSLREAHRQLIENKGLQGQHFDAVIENLRMTLTDLDVTPAVVNEVVKVVKTTRAEVFGL